MQNYKTYTVDEATKLLAAYCSYQERCHKEVEKKLTDLRMIPEAKEKIILFLLEQDFVNEERFAKTFTRGKFSIKKWGKIRIKKELRSRNISSYNIQTALKEIDPEDYLKNLREIAEKKLPLIKESNPYKKCNKLSNYLVSKGYETHLVYPVVKALVSL